MSSHTWSQSYIIHFYTENGTNPTTRVAVSTTHPRSWSERRYPRTYPPKASCPTTSGSSWLPSSWGPRVEAGQSRLRATAGKTHLKYCLSTETLATDTNIGFYQFVSCFVSFCFAERNNLPNFVSFRFDLKNLHFTLPWKQVRKPARWFNSLV